MIKSTPRVIDEFFYFLITYTFGFFIGFFLIYEFFFNNPKWFRTDIQVTFIKSMNIFFITINSSSLYNFLFSYYINFYLLILMSSFLAQHLVYFSFALWSYLQDILNITFLIVYEELIYMVMIFIFLTFYLGYG